jgi:hypothetical protein
MKKILEKLGIDSLKVFFSVLLIVLGLIILIGTLLYLCYSLHWILGLILTGFLFIIVGIGITDLL